MSELRAHSYVILLGEPGSGKSVVLSMEAAHESGAVLTVRQLMTGAIVPAGATLYLDALDEYRIDGEEADKVHRLAGVMARANRSRWRLTCRAEDWRKDADLAAIRQAADGRGILVVQLLPLSLDEAKQVLATLGHREPQTFLERARTFGASGLLESPLSLRLLYQAVTEEGNWPQNRYELFESAIQRLAHEHNNQRKRALRRPVSKIIEAAEITCLTLLASGSRAVWRSHGEPPFTSTDSRAYLRAYELDLEDVLVEDMLDSSLFRGEGEEFEPMHRTVAEYLGSRALARAVLGGRDRAAIPLGRARSIIAATDRMPPTELRGVYAWFAAHLAKMGQFDFANQLIESDAATVLMYGDADAFTTPLRRTILRNLGQKDPFFRDYETSETALSGLANDDLAQDFIDILTNPYDGTHRLATIFEVLTSGPPVKAVRPLLRTIALDIARPAWQRMGAAAAWLNGSPPAAAHELLSALASEPVSSAREELRLHLATRLPAGTLNCDELKSLLRDFESTPADDTVGRLILLSLILRKSPPVELFDQPLRAWLPGHEPYRHEIELTDFFDTLLAASIRATPALTADRLWRWTKNARRAPEDTLQDNSARAVREWLDADASREVAFFNAVLADEDPVTAPWEPGNHFASAAGRYPSPDLTRHLISRVAATPASGESSRLLAIAVELACRQNDEAVFEEVFEFVTARADHAELVQRLTAARNPTASQRLAERERTRIEQSHKRHEESIARLTPLIGELSVGKHTRYLYQAALRYFAPPNGRDAQEQDGFSAVVSDTNPTIAAAIDAGWRYLATKDLTAPDARSMGTMYGNGRHYFVEVAAAAGVDRILAEGRSPEIGATPDSVAIAVLNSSSYFGSSRTQLESWAIDRLNVDPDAGAAQLLDFWGAALDAGATHLEMLQRVGSHPPRGGAVAKALEVLLSSRPTMSVTALHQALWAAARHLSHSRLVTLARAALTGSEVVGEPRQTWSVVAFALDPVTQRDRFLTEHKTPEAVGSISEHVRNYALRTFELPDAASRVERASLIVRMMGPLQAPAHDRATLAADSNHAVICTANPQDLRDIITSAIQWLTIEPSRTAEVALETLALDPTLASWHPQLRHAHAAWARGYRERSFSHPTPSALREALAGGPPLNAADLKEVVLEELNRLRRELRASDVAAWKHYWSREGENPTKPLVENECRNQLLVLLRARLERYRITAALPEASRSDGTRTDVLILTGANRNLPIEIKRNFHPEVWRALHTQLPGYADSEGADGFGIYLVLWFGNGLEPTPARDDGTDGPRTADELERMLAADLPQNRRDFISVIVLDMSKPGAVTRKPRKKRTAKAANRL